MTSAAQKVLTGRGCIQQLQDILREGSPSRVFLATGGSSYVKSGAKAALEKVLRAASVTTFHTDNANLQLQDVEAAVNVFQQEKCDYVIGVGGGLVMDLAKSVSLLATQIGTPQQYILGELTPTPREIESVMIPTTAGSGSESTHFSVVYINSTKSSLAHQSMLADVAFLDASLTDSLPAHNTANSGLDVLCQGIESFWSVRSTEMSRSLSVQAIELVLKNLIPAVTAPNEKVRDCMLEAANLAGQAINIARTTAAHALSYYLTTEYGVPHGHAVALILPHLFVCNSLAAKELCNDPRGPEFLQNRLKNLLQILAVETPQEAREKLVSIVESAGLATRLSEVGVTENNLLAMVQSSLGSDRAGNNPITLGENELNSILRDAL